jgi:hypothetical protein
VIITETCYLALKERSFLSCKTGLSMRGNQNNCYLLNSRLNMTRWTLAYPCTRKCRKIKIEKAEKWIHIFKREWSSCYLFIDSLIYSKDRLPMMKVISTTELISFFRIPSSVGLIIKWHARRQFKPSALHHKDIFSDRRRFPDHHKNMGGSCCCYCYPTSLMKTTLNEWKVWLLTWRECTWYIRIW